MNVESYRKALWAKAAELYGKAAATMRATGQFRFTLVDDVIFADPAGELELGSVQREAGEARIFSRLEMSGWGFDRHCK